MITHSRPCGLYLFVIALLLPASSNAQSAADSADVVNTVARFHAALASGDSAAALALLADDAIVLEAGGIETRSEYRAHHLPADIEFARAIAGLRKVQQVRSTRAAAWVISSSVTQGTFRDRPIDSEGAELIVLRKVAGDWRIAAIHWSSHARRRN